ncbi:MAG: adenosylcobinamide-GDP ribazoletransferase [Verrucomicrobia bacterium]|nr:adenosylcobinamide-GDP ribazoletransferase [Cytophagales bacterium]
MLQKEIQCFFTALMFFTRIPCPAWVNHSEEILNKSSKYFPVVGWIVGALSALVAFGSLYLFPVPVAIVLSMIASIFITGAFHEDGFADVCDGFGGGWTKEQILTIMKDSRLGTYGVTGLFLVLLAKFLLLTEIARINLCRLEASLEAAHAASRFIAVTFIQTHTYVQDPDKSKSKPIASRKLGTPEILFSAFTAIIPLFLFKEWLFFMAFPLAFLTKLYLGSYFKKRIGGYTGDCLGATQQVSELVFYMAIVGLWKFL